MTQVSPRAGESDGVRRLSLRGNAIGLPSSLRSPVTVVHTERVPGEPGPYTADRRRVVVQVRAREAMLAPLRNILGAIATFEGLDSDAVADLCLAVDEACAVLINAAAADSMVSLDIVADAHRLVVDASTTCSRPEDAGLGPFSERVLSALTDEVGTFTTEQNGDPRGVFGISLTTRRKPPTPAG
ncbi:ATP-binding protein [Mycolicibacterium goodii]|uniref:ATP-binding protein n=1 Tax=Mycolicibacterium goodii TaxID=134601 RepID=UPI001BDC9B06|nr:ATP-binding protein [Mycolicibacterium goodii]MBU8818896.1 ATP-binding protein [Mycolicibacterium goodii]MBU8828535.1 ATP-binding protein [Mycolicibacterium goodii]